MSSADIIKVKNGVTFKEFKQVKTLGSSNIEYGEPRIIIKGGLYASKEN